MTNTETAAVESFMVRLYASRAARGLTDPLAAEFGRVYARVFQFSGSSRSVVCFVELSTGYVYTAKSWKAPNLRARMGHVDTWGVEVAA